METVEGENPSSHIMGTVEEEPEQSESPIKVDKEENLPAKAMKSSAEKTFRPHFVERVTKWPMINATLAFTTTTYNKVKNASPQFVKDAWNATERGFISVIQIFRAPAQVVDSLACKTLDTVEQVVPALTKRQEEVRGYVSESLQPVKETLSGIYDAVEMAGERVIDRPFRQLVDSVKVSVAGVYTWMRNSLSPGTADVNRLSIRAQHSLHDLGFNGLTYAGALVNIFEWVLVNWKDAEAVELPPKLSELAARYDQVRSTDSKDGGPVNDVVFLVRLLTQGMMGLVLSSLKALSRLPGDRSKRLEDLRLELAEVLKLTTDFLVKFSKVHKTDEVVAYAEEFLLETFPAVHNMLLMAKEYCVDTEEEYLESLKMDACSLH